MFLIAKLAGENGVFSSCTIKFAALAGKKNNQL